MPVPWYLIGRVTIIGWKPGVCCWKLEFFTNGEFCESGCLRFPNLFELDGNIYLNVRIPASVITGFCHLLIGSIHVYRLWDPFRFEVFGYAWSYGASLREVAIVVPFGALCLFIASKIARERA